MVRKTMNLERHIFSAWKDTENAKSLHMKVRAFLARRKSANSPASKVGKDGHRCPFNSNKRDKDNGWKLEMRKAKRQAWNSYRRTKAETFKSAFDAEGWGTSWKNYRKRVNKYNNNEHELPNYFYDEEQETRNAHGHVDELPWYFYDPHDEDRDEFGYKWKYIDMIGDLPKYFYDHDEEDRDQWGFRYWDEPEWTEEQTLWHDEVHNLWDALETRLLYDNVRSLSWLELVPQIDYQYFEPESGQTTRVSSLPSGGDGFAWGNDPEPTREKEVNREKFEKRRAKRDKLPPRFQNFEPESYDLLDDDCIAQINRFTNLMAENADVKAENKIFFRRMEDLVLTVVKLSLCSDWRLALLEIFSYARTFTDESVIASFGEHIYEIFRLSKDITFLGLLKNFVPRDISESPYGVHPVPHEFEAESGFDGESIVALMRNLLANWTTAVNNPIFNKISYILSSCVTLGLCEATQVHWNIAGVRLFNVNTFQKHVNAADFLSALFETVVYFVEGGIELFTTGSLAGFLYSDTKIRVLQDNFNFLKANIVHVRTGNLRKLAGITEAEFSEKIDKTIMGIAALKKFSDGYDRITLGKMEQQMYALKSEFQVLRGNGGIKKAPIVVSIHGASGQGKSTISARLMIEIHRALGLPCDPQYFAYYSSLDEYDTGLTGNITGIFFDELGNTKAEFLQKVAYEFLMRANNNARSKAIMAEVELKGQIELEPDVVIITTNDKFLGGPEGSKEPVSVVRRADIHIHVQVRPEFTISENNGMIDPDKVKAVYGNCPPGEIQDVWLMKLESAYGVDNIVKGRAQKIAWKQLSDNEGELKDVGYKRALRYIVNFARKKRADQEELVNRTNSLHEHIVCCKECGELTSLCECFDSREQKLARTEYGIDESDEDAEVTMNRFTSRAIRSATPVSVVETVSPIMTKVGELDAKVSISKKVRALQKSSEIPGRVRIANLREGKRSIERIVETVEPEGGHYDDIKHILIGACNELKTQKILSLKDMWNSFSHILPGSVKNFTSRTIGRVFVRRLVSLFDDFLSLVNFMLTQRKKRKQVEIPFFFQVMYHAFDYEIEELEVELERVDATAMLSLGIALSILFGIMSCSFRTLFYAIIAMGLAWTMFRLRVISRTAQVENRHKAIRQIAENIREVRVKNIVIGLGALGGAYVLAKSYRKMAPVVYPHGNLMPKTQGDIDERDKEVNIWQKAKVEKLPESMRKLDTATDVERCNTIWKNLMVLVVETDSGNTICDALFLESNLALIPHHMVRDGHAILNFYRNGPDIAGGHFKCHIDGGNSYRIPNTDLVLVSVPNSGTFANITELLPSKQYSGTARFIHKQRDGSRREERALMTPELVGHSLCQFSGYRTRLDNPTERGLCMGVFITSGRAPHIAGFHLGGELIKTCIGVAGYLSKTQYLNAKMEVAARKGIFVPHSAGNFPSVILGKPILLSEEIHHKSPVNFLETSSCFKVYGSCAGGITFASKVIKSIASPLVEKYMGQPNIWGPPHTDYKWRPWHTALNGFANASAGFRPLDLAWAVEDYISPLRELMQNPINKKMVRPLDPIQTINGIPGEKYIDKMNFNASIGFPLTGAKEKFLVPIEGGVSGYDEAYTFTPEIWTEINRAEECWLNGERAYTPVKACLKDEPTKLSKEKIRVFYSMAISAQYHLRRMTLGLTRFIQMNQLDTESMVGMNCMGPDWQVCREWFFDGDFNPDLYKGKNTSAGDYQGYDTVMPAQVTMASLSIYRELLVLSGNFTKRDLLIFDGVCTEILYPIVAFNGTLLEIMAGTISGHNLTVHINNTDNSLLKRLGFLNVELKPRNLVGLLSFRDCERCGNYGDDCKSTINKSRVMYWSMKTYRDFLATHNITFTMPDKTSEMVDFMNWDEAEFLKRHDAFVPELGVHLGRLDEMSIYKSLHSNLKSSVLSAKQHVCAVMAGAAHEWFPYGREHYELRMSQLRQVAADLEIIVPEIEMTFDDRITKWRRDYVENKICTLEITTCDTTEALGVSQTNLIVSDEKTSSVVQHSENIEQELGFDPVLSERPGICNFCNKSGSAPTLYGSTEEVDASGRTDTYVSTPTTSSLSLSSDFEPESGAFTIQAVNGKTQENITMFSDYNAGYHYNLGDMSDATYGAVDDTNLSLSEFFARPILINTFAWTGTPVSDTVDVWGAYLNNPRVSNRLSNYKNLRCRLHVKVVLNGNPFYYGLGLLSYQPNANLDEFFDFGDIGTGKLVQMSQMPHLWLDPSNNVGGELTLPFLYNQNAFNLASGDGIIDMGRIMFEPVIPLKHASGTVAPITVTYFAWLSDVHLTGPTSHNMYNVQPQGDEFGVSLNNVSPMTSIKRAMTWLQPYARATQMMLETGISAAKLLGFARPTVLENVNAMSQKPFGNLTNVNLGDAAQKLSLDAKQETVIDPRTVGVSPDDEMHLIELAKRESYITSFPWDTTDGVGEVLHYHKVTPMQFVKSSDAIPAYYMTPSAWVAAPFTYWRGSMMFRFKIVASNFHKGRLRISYDPEYSQEVDDMNVVRNHIVDIAECKDFCVTIGWNQPRAYARVGQFGDVPYQQLEIALPNNDDLCNGTFKVEVVNELVSSNPLVDNNIFIVVMCAMCDDFEVQAPNGAAISGATYWDPNTPPGRAFEPEGDVVATDEAGGEDNAPCMERSECSMGAELPIDHTPEIFFGENILSWRTCLKRYNWHNTIYFNPSAGAITLNTTRPVFPCYRGYDPNGMHVTETGAIPYNFTEMTLLNWVAPAYIGYRGTIRHKYSANCVRQSGNSGIMEVSRFSTNENVQEDTFAKSVYSNVDNSSSNSYWYRKHFTHTWHGSAYTSLTHNPVLETEFPYYENRRYINTRVKNVNTSTNYPVLKLELDCMSQVTVGNFVAVGDDFTLFFFLCTPKAWISGEDPVPKF